MQRKACGYLQDVAYSKLSWKAKVIHGKITEVKASTYKFMQMAAHEEVSTNLNKTQKVQQEYQLIL
jgi:hypothetical protein